MADDKSESKRDERNGMEIDELKSAIEACNGDRSAAKMRLNESEIKGLNGVDDRDESERKKFDRSSDRQKCGILTKTGGFQPKMRRLMSDFAEDDEESKAEIEVCSKYRAAAKMLLNELRIEDSNGVKYRDESETRKLNEMESDSSDRVECEISMRSEELELKICRLDSVFGENGEEFEAVKCDLTNGNGNFLEKTLKEFDQLLDTDGIEDDTDDNVDGFARNDEKDVDGKRDHLNRLLKNTEEFDGECELLKVLSDRVVELESEISSLQVDLAMFVPEKDKAVVRFRQLKSELELLKWRNIEKEMEIVELVKGEIAALLEPTDGESRDKMESLIQSQVDQIMKRTKTKMARVELELKELGVDRNKFADTKAVAGTAEKGLRLIWPPIAVVGGTVAALGAVFWVGKAKVQRGNKN